MAVFLSSSTNYPPVESRQWLGCWQLMTLEMMELIELPGVGESWGGGDVCKAAAA